VGLSTRSFEHNYSVRNVLARAAALACLSAGFVLAAGCGSAGSGPDHTLLYVSQGRGQLTHLAAVEPGGENRRAVTEPTPPSARAVAWSPTAPDAILVEGAGIWLADSTTGGMRKIANGWKAFWSPDGQRIAVIDDGKVIVLTSQGEKLREFEIPDPDFPDGPTLAWSPDGSELAVATDLPGGKSDFLEPSQLLVIPVAGGERTVLVEAEHGITRVRWSPDGKTLAYRLENVETVQGELWTVARAGGAPERQRQGLSGFAWADDGVLVFSISEGGDGPCTVYVGRKKVWSGGFVFDLAFARGTIALATEDGLVLLRADGQRREFLGAETRSPSFSFDGSEVAFVNSGEVIVARVDGSSRRELTRPHADRFPAWAADGTKIAFVRHAAAKPPEVIVANANGTDERSVGEGSRPIWTRDGRWLVVTREAKDPEAPPEIWRLGVDGNGQQKKLADGSHPSVSQDGTRVAFVRYTTVELYDEIYTDASTIFTISIEGTRLRRAASAKGTEALHLYESVWLTGDKELAVVRRSIGETDLARVSLEGETRRVTDLNALSSAFAYSPDGSRLAYFRSSPRSELVITRPGEDPVGVAQRLGRTFLGPITWSPDGRKLAFFVDDHDTESEEVAVIDADGSSLRTVGQTLPYDDVGAAVWRPLRGSP
jgi:Tol biopolymer transport system component